MSGAPLSLRVDLAAEGAEPAELEDATADLRRELLELDVRDVQRPRGVPPEGTRSGDAVTIGTLLVTLGPGLLAAATAVVQHWMARRGGRSAVLELDGDRIELSGISEDEQRRVLETFLERHTRA